MKNKKLKTVLIGMGSVGYKNDILMPNKIRTHYKALSLNKRIDLIGVLELKKKFRYMKKLKDIKIYNNFDHLKKLDFEIAVVAVPTIFHYRVLKFLIKLKQVKCIICEKPFTNKIEKSKNIFFFSKKNNTKIYINYFRRAIPSFQLFKEFIKKKKILDVNIYYSKNLMRNGCHFIDFVQYLFGKITFCEYKKNINKTIIKISNKKIIFNKLKTKNNINFLEINLEKNKIIIDRFSKIYEKNIITNNIKLLKKFKQSRNEMNIYQKLSLDLFLKDYLYNKKKNIIATEEQIIDTFKVLRKTNYN